MIQYIDGNKVVQVSAKKVLFDRFYAKSQRSFSQLSCLNVFHYLLYTGLFYNVHCTWKGGEARVGLYL